MEVRGEGEQESVFIKECTEVNRPYQKQIYRGRKYRNYAGKWLNPLRMLDLEPKIRNKLSEKSDPCKGHFFSRQSYVFLQTTK